LQEAARPALAPVGPELSKGFLAHGGSVQPLVRGPQDLQGGPSFARQIRPLREPGGLLPREGAPIFAPAPSVHGLAHCSQGIAQMTPKVKLVEPERRLGRLRPRGVAKRLPPVPPLLRVEFFGAFQSGKLAGAGKTAPARHTGILQHISASRRETM